MLSLGNFTDDIDQKHEFDLMVQVFDGSTLINRYVYNILQPFNTKLSNIPKE